jgi:xylulokinase
MAVLGLDLGTSGVKALVLADDGTVSAVASAACSLDRPRPGWAEADPANWLLAARAAVHDALGRAGREPLRAVGLAGQMHGVVVCDASGRPVRPALLWPDRRAVDVLEVWRGLPDERRAALANPLVPGMAGPLLAWLARHEPAALDAAAWALQAKDWIRLMLTGEVATEPTDASATLLWDLPADGWATDVAEAAGIDARLLATLAASDAPTGALTAAGAEALGVAGPLPVYGGAADTAAALVGAGVTRPGQRLLNVGTGAQLVTIMEGPAAAARPTTHRYRAARGGWYAMAAVQNAGLAIGWAREVVAASWEETEREAFGDRASGDAEGDPLFVPYLTGERTPFLDPDARGAWIGLSLEHRRGDLLRAAHAGVAHAVRLARDALRAEGGAGAGILRLLGGGSLRPGYRQLFADTLDEPLELLAVADATALGAALLAGGQAPEPTREGIVEPDPHGVARAADRHERWLAAVEALRTRAPQQAPTHV